MNSELKRNAVDTFIVEVLNKNGCKNWLVDTIISFLESGKPSALYPISPFYQSHLSIDDILIDFSRELRKTKGERELYSPYTLFLFGIIELAGERSVLLQNVHTADVILNLIKRLSIVDAIPKLLNIINYESLSNTEIKVVDPIDIFRVLISIGSSKYEFLEYYQRYIPIIKEYYSLSAELLRELILLDDDIENIVKYFDTIGCAINLYKDHYGLTDNEEEFEKLRKIIHEKFWKPTERVSVFLSSMKNQLSFIVPHGEAEIKSEHKKKVKGKIPLLNKNLREIARSEYRNASPRKVERYAAC